MNITLAVDRFEQVQADAIVVVAFARNGAADGAGGAAGRLDALNGGWLGELFASKEFSAKLNETALLYRPAGVAAGRLLVIGGGKAADFDAARLRQVAGTAARLLKAKRLKRIGMVLETNFCSADSLSAAVEGAVLGNFDPDRYKTNSEAKTSLDELVLIVEGDAAGSEAAMERGRILAEAQNLARALGNEPANEMTPQTLTIRAREVASQFGLGCDVLHQDRMKQLGMGALLGVAQGSIEPPALIVLRYEPPNDPQDGTHLALVGKGVTFDTGGISIKPAENMDKMKMDMAGAAAVIGAMQAIAQLKPAARVTGFIPTVENMASHTAQRPGDIVKTMSGKTVEVLNTDAEGRLILIDAMTYAKSLGCTHLVDAATLTGAIVVALGAINTGVFSNDESLQGKLLRAARTEGEKMWPMPLDDEYRDMLKSEYADLPNIASRWGGAITASAFLKEFADPAPWVHLDIAGTAWFDDAKPYMSKGATGVAVRTFVRLVEDWT